jgi:chromosome segregation ATPase
MPDTQAQHRMRMMHRSTIDPVQALKARLDRVTTDLHLKPEQEADWEALRKHLIARAQQASEQMKLKRAAMMQAPQPHAVSRAHPDRYATNNQMISPDQALEQRAQRLRDQAKQLDQTAVLVKALYEKLSPEQRTIMRLHREQKPARMQAWQSMQTLMPAIPGGGPAERMKRGAIHDDESPVLAGLPQAAQMMAMMESVQAMDQSDAFDEALSLMR